MPQGPRPVDIPRLRTTTKLFKVSAVITGTFLLLLVLMMVFRYGMGVDIELLGPFGFLALTPQPLITGINLSSIILIVHGWFYVLYVAADFLLWRFARWSFTRFLLIALGGVVPVLSYYYEFRVPRWVDESIAVTEAREAEAAAA